MQHTFIVPGKIDKQMYKGRLIYWEGPGYYVHHPTHTAGWEKADDPALRKALIEKYSYTELHIESLE